MQTEENEIVKNWDHPISLSEEKTLYKLLTVITEENRRIDVGIEEIYDDKFLNTATGTELEKLGDWVGVERKTGEGDDKLRTRIKAEFAAQASDTTYETFAKVTLSILETTPKTIDINTPPNSNPKVIEIEVDGSVLDDSSLSISELTPLLNKTVSADARVDIITTGTFAFAGDDTALKGWNEGTWSSTI